MAKLIVHMIGNAHLDPVWRWRWSAGLDEALATAWSAVHRLEEYPEFIFTRPDSWFHEQIELVDPELFARIKRFVSEGRWQIVGGWYVQTDCNLLTEWSFLKQAQIAKAYFHGTFNKDVTVAYNVDSFGHAGSLPSILQRSGFDSYVFMRPEEHERHLDTNLFNWCSSCGEASVLTFRINHAYCCTEKALKESLNKAIDGADEGIGHTMCFYGVGDHGGGPTKQQIEFILENRHSFADVELVFSHPRAFFDAVSDKRAELPSVVGELQMHAIGCYSVMHRFKQSIRRAENAMIQAQAVARQYPEAAEPDFDSRMLPAIKRLLFNQFHDILPGSSIREAYSDAFDQVGAATAAADEQTVLTLRRHAAGLDYTPGHHFALANTAPETFNGFVEHCVWMPGDQEPKRFRLLDHKNRTVPYQIVPGQLISQDHQRILFPADLPPESCNVLSVIPADSPPEQIDTDIVVDGGTIANRHWRLNADADCLTLRTAAGPAIEIRYPVRRDTSDTWSHEHKGFTEELIGAFGNGEPVVEATGPLKATLCWQADWEKSSLVVRMSLYRHEPWVQLRISTVWNAKHAILKAVLAPCGDVFSGRTDGLPGSQQARELDGREYPFHDWSVLQLTQAGRGLAIVSPDIFGIDCEPSGAALTLLRCPPYAYDHTGTLDPAIPHDFTDQGRHDYSSWLSMAENIDCHEVARMSRAVQHQPIAWDLPRRTNHTL